MSHLITMLLVSMSAGCVVRAALWTKTGDACIKDNNDKILSNVANITTCKLHCEQYDQHTCLSIDWNESSGGCHLSRYNSNNAPGDAYTAPCYSPPWEYAERLDPGVWTPTRSACIRERNAWVGKSVDIDACKLRCAQEKSCCSIDFKDGTCHLSLYKQSTASTDYTSPCYVPGWQYAEVTFRRCSMRLRWKPKKKACIRGRNNRIRTATSMGVCKRYCVDETDFLCKSVDFDGTTCDLSVDDSQTAGTDYTEPCYLTGWKYAEREFY